MTSLSRDELLLKIQQDLGSKEDVGFKIHMENLKPEEKLTVGELTRSVMKKYNLPFAEVEQLSYDDLHYLLYRWRDSK